MRNLLFTLVAVVLLAAACGPDERAAVQGTAAVRPRSETSGVAAESEQAHEPSGDAPQVDEPHAAFAVTNATVCGFDEDLKPDRIEVAQIPGDGRENTVSALDFPDDASFGEPLVDLNRILSGGPPPDGIPPIDAPVFQTANTVDWIHCTEPVLALSVDGETRAYPVQIMTWHELVNDTFGDVRPRNRIDVDTLQRHRSCRHPRWYPA